MRKQPVIAFQVLLAALLTAGTGTVVAQTTFNPVQLTPNSYTVDIIVESNAPPALPNIITATQGAGPTQPFGDATWYEIGFRLPPYNVTNGLPHPGTLLTDLSNTNVQYLMPPSYSTNDAFMVDASDQSVTMTFDTPTTATNLSFFGSSGGGSLQFNYTVHHSNGNTEAGTITYPDWFNNTPYAYTTSGRAYPGGGTDSEGSTNPRLYSRAITVSGASPVTSIDFTYSSTGGSGHAAILAVSGNASGAAWTPIPVSGFNEDIIAEAWPYLPVNATMDQGTNLVGTLGQNTWFEQGYDTAAPAAGLPHPGQTFASSSQPTHFYQLAPSFTTNDAILIDTNHQVANITLVTPTAYTAFAVLTAGGDVGSGTMTNQIVLQHQDGTSETNIFFGYDWFNNAQAIAVDANGRIDVSSPALNNVNNNYPRLFESVFGLTDTSSPVTNVVVKYQTAPFANSTTYVMALSASTGAVAPVINLQTPWVNVFTGDTASFHVSLSAGSQPLTFQWQKDGLNLTDGSHISGATTTNLVVTGTTMGDDGNYQLMIQNNAGTIYSTPIPLTVMSRLPDVTEPNDAVSAYEPNGGSSPGGSGPANAIDDTTSEFQDYGGNSGSIPFVGPIGVVVTPSSGASVVTAVRVYAATTAAVDDPTAYTLEGSTDGVSFVTISSGSMSLPDARNTGGDPLNPTNQILTELDFPNTTSYSIYRVSFDSPKDPTTADSIRIGEIELLGTNVATAPFILTDIQPLSQTNYVGALATLSLQAGGTPQLSYQWERDGSAVADATNKTYSFSTMTGVHTYVCSVTNLYGSTNSLTASVTGLPIDASTTFAVNLNDYDNFALEYGQNQYNPYVGPGAYPGATVNDFWNGFGLESNGNNPYPANGLLSDSTGIPVGISYDINYDANNGGLYFSAGPYQGTPGFLFGQAALASGTDVGTLTLHNVPSGTYDLYLYGANFDGTRGALFTVSSGAAAGGIAATTNPYSSGGSGPLTTFSLGVDYVQFTGVTPNGSGDILITWAQNVNDNSGGGEGDFNGMSLVRVGPGPTQLSIHMSGVNAILSWSPTNGVLQSATDVAGPYNDITNAASPYTNAVSGTQFFRVKVQ